MADGAKRWIGSIVRLNRDVETRGGVMFRAGVEMKVVDSNAGGLYLRTYKRGWYHACTSIPKRYVTVVRWNHYEEHDEVGDQEWFVENPDRCPFAP